MHEIGSPLRRTKTMETFLADNTKRHEDPNTLNMEVYFIFNTMKITLQDVITTNEYSSNRRG